MPCSPSDVSINPPSGPSGPSIPGFGVPFAISLPNINPFPPGFPEDLLNILNSLQLLIPPGALMPTLNLNFGKDIFDAIMKLLDQFMPFLMLYKFFLPILNIIVCIIEVICAIPNPFKLIPAIIKLFTQCIPAFLLLFPIFALIIMIISLILLIIALVEYIIEKIIALVLLLVRNILMLVNAFQEFNVNSVLAIAQKIGASLCIFQNLFVLLAIFNIIIQIIKDILGMAFAIPPCEDSGCCTTDVCPSIAKNPFTRTTGTLQYLNEAGLKVPTGLASPYDSFNFDVRAESWQLYDASQPLPQMFLNVIDAYDVPPDTTNFDPPFFKPVFFPTDSTFTSKTPANQAAYTVDLRLFYNPLQWGRTGLARFIRIKNCIMLTATSLTLSDYQNNAIPVPTGVLSLAGGKVYEDDGKTPIKGFAADGITEISSQGTLNNFLHKAAISSSSPTLNPTDGYTYHNDVEYTFTPNSPILMGKNLITLGCVPDVSIAKGFVNNALAGDVALKTVELQNILNSSTFPKPDVAQQCLTNALAILRNNLTVQGVSDFQSAAISCLQQLQNDAKASLISLIGLGFDPCKSTFNISPNIQFTSKPIVIQVNLNENNGISLTKGISPDVAAKLAPNIKAYTTFGQVSDFTFDGYQFFTANLTSDSTGTGQIMISFENNIFCNNDLVTPSHTLQTLDYQFVYTPVQGQIVAVGDKSDGKPERDGSDLANDAGD